MSKSVLNIGFDDTDSPSGMCTTFLAYKIVEQLQKQKIEFVDYPRLIRFNPNIPWKTRGNGAVSIQIKTDNPSKIKRQIKNLVMTYSDTNNGANPGLVFFDSDVIPSEFTKFSELALWQLIKRNQAKKFAQQNDIEFFYQGNGQGLIGAIGAIGYPFEDHTMELLSYRDKSKFGKKREISLTSVKLMHEKTSPNTFNSIDSKKDKMLISPHGPDPVLYGIRGENVKSLVSASKIIQTKEKPVGYMIFKSNQGTGDHLKHELTSETMKPYASGTIIGYLSEDPQILRGGHVLFKISASDVEFFCAVYKPTGMSVVASRLIKGDKIHIGGGVRPASKNFPRVVNIEFIKILNLEKNFSFSNPLCKQCMKKMKSKGQNQGFQCVKCGNRQSKKVQVKIQRELETKLYLPKNSAHRHLTRPSERIGRKNQINFDDTKPWFCVYRK